MRTPRECYQMADQCERQAAQVQNARAREILLEAAALWRKLGDDLTGVDFGSRTSRQA